MCMSCVGPFSIKGQSFWQQIIQHWSLLESTSTTSTKQPVFHVQLELGYSQLLVTDLCSDQGPDECAESLAPDF